MLIICYLKLESNIVVLSVPLTAGLLAAALLSMQLSPYLSGASGCSIHGIVWPVVQERETWVGNNRTCTANAILACNCRHL